MSNDLDAILDAGVAAIRAIPPFNDPGWERRIRPGFEPDDAWFFLPDPEGLLLSFLPLSPLEDGNFGSLSDPAPQTIGFELDLTIAVKATASAGIRNPGEGQFRAEIRRALQLAQKCLGLKGKNLGTNDCPLWAWPARPTLEPWRHPSGEIGAFPTLLLVRFNLQRVELQLG